MTVTKALLTVAVSALLAGAVGAGVGYALDHWTPSFFRILWPGRPGDPADPVEVGLGLGISQGLVWGVVVGLLVVAIVAWHDTRIPATRDKRSDTPGDPGTGR